MSKKEITLNVESFDNLLWCATRYCIGRHSYVSTYAEDFWRIINANRGKFNPNRLKFFARDVRTEVSCVVNYHGNVQVENVYNDRIVYDAYTLLARLPHIQKDVEYTVDCISGEITEEPYKTNGLQTHFNLSEWACDLLPWVRLANCIDRQFEVTCEYDGKVETAICIQDPDGTYICVENWRRQPIKEYIKEVKRYASWART